jgi:hypothetical protein
MLALPRINQDQLAAVWALNVSRWRWRSNGANSRQNRYNHQGKRPEQAPKNQPSKAAPVLCARNNRRSDAEQHPHHEIFHR